MICEANFNFQLNPPLLQRSEPTGTAAVRSSLAPGLTGHLTQNAPRPAAVGREIRPGAASEDGVEKNHGRPLYVRKRNVQVYSNGENGPLSLLVQQNVEVL